MVVKVLVTGLLFGIPGLPFRILGLQFGSPGLQKFGCNSMKSRNIQYVWW